LLEGPLDLKSLGLSLHSLLVNPALSVHKLRVTSLILGPLLFLIYVNDIAKNIKASISLFADDTTLRGESKPERPGTPFR